MRKLIMKMSVSVDGFVGRSNGEVDWIFKSSDETSRAWLVEHTSEAGLIVMGRKSYEVLNSYWPTAPGALAEQMNKIPKVFFTKKGFNRTAGDVSSPAAASWADAMELKGDLAEEVSKLKAGEGKPILAIAGAEFNRNLIATGLVDEYVIVTHPVILGEGFPIFNGVRKPVDLKLVEVKGFGGGVVVHRYDPA